MMRLVVFSDLHLDAPFAWVRPEAARALRRELRETLVRIVELAGERGAQAILCAGDLYEHERASADTAEFLRHTLSAAPCQVILAPGNHDPMVGDSLYARTEFGPNVRIVREPRFSPIALSEGVALWAAAHVQTRGTPSFFEGGVRAAGPGVHLALFHGSEQQFLAFEGERKVGHAPFSAGDLAAAGFHHAFVGHYHRPRLEPTFTYPGAPAFLGFGGPVGGAVVAEVAEDGTVTRESVRVSALEAHDLEVDVTGLPTLEAMRRHVAEQLAGRGGIARLSLRGELPAAMEFRPGDLALETLGDSARGLLDLQVRAERLASAFDLDAIAGESSVRGEFVRRVRAAELDETTRARVLAAGLRALAGRDDLEVVA
jgi:DNA repair protein SbcD/Mre11